MYLNGQDAVLSVWVRMALHPFIRQILNVNPHFPYPTSTIISTIYYYTFKCCSISYLSRLTCYFTLVAVTLNTLNMTVYLQINLATDF